MYKFILKVFVFLNLQFKIAFSLLLIVVIALLGCDYKTRFSFFLDYCHFLEAIAAFCHNKNEFINLKISRKNVQLTCPFLLTSQSHTKCVFGGVLWLLYIFFNSSIFRPLHPTQFFIQDSTFLCKCGGLVSRRVRVTSLKDFEQFNKIIFEFVLSDGFYFYFFQFCFMLIHADKRKLYTIFRHFYHFCGFAKDNFSTSFTFY